ncbi:hypothetical protein M378DRAFT_170686 [Amanita muscaria Koide BX008]|uniref:Uncharacterized protein n=1 Tax=Amanita muscaria (strain Koide BX008) TaxID=946122 RepID=A0A0C2WNR7_AMAMK|nr:hypothetical protein M378DRAFT_170686 [Amanita muscaria Koide BX008]
MSNATLHASFRKEPSELGFKPVEFFLSVIYLTFRLKRKLFKPEFKTTETSCSIAFRSPESQNDQ